MKDLSQRIEALSPERRLMLELMRKGKQAQKERLQPIPRTPDQTSFPLSFAQERLWVLEQLEPGSSFYNYATAVRFEGPLQVAVLEQSINAIVCRHEALRTVFAVEDGEPVQRVLPQLTVPLHIVDLRCYPASEREQVAQHLVTAEARRPFNLEHGPLLRASLFCLADQQYIVLLAIHHIITDGWSLGVLVRDISAFYQAFVQGQPAPLAELPIQYSDFAVWQRRYLQGETLQTLLKYWKEQLRDQPVLQLPLDRPRPAVQTYRGATHAFVLPKALIDTLKEAHSQEGVSLYMLLLTTFMILLYRYTGQHDIVVGSLVANRNRAEIEDLIGYFVNVLVMRTELSGERPFRDLLRQLREVALNAYANQDLPFEKLIAELKPERDLSRNPLAQVLFVFQNPPGMLQLPGLQATPVNVDLASVHFDLVLEMSESSAGLTAAFHYNVDLFDASTIERMARHLRVLLEGIAAYPHQAVADLPLLDATERQQLLLGWNNTTAPYPQHMCLHQLFEAQVARTPDAVAVRYQEQQLSYHALNERANQLAHYLQQQGIGTETRVGICVERSLEMLIGLLGILKAGAAYVPLDPSYPTERLAFMAANAKIALLLTQQQLGERIPDYHGPRLCLDSDWPRVVQAHTSNPTSNTTPDQVAYVIYTSGSTGQPKGVLGLHRGAVNRFHWMWEVYPFAPSEICCQKTALSFVDSIWELFGPLLRGVPTVIIPTSVVQDPQQLMLELQRSAITRIVLVPSLLRMLLRADPAIGQRLSALKYWVSSGEALPLELVQQFYAALPNHTLINLYGSSEVSADVTAYVALASEPVGTVPLGQPIFNTSAYVLDVRLQLVPSGVPGELYIGGAGLARGYQDRPDLTAERFCPDPFSRTPGARLYKTGDLARYRSDGVIEFLGRRDYQVKIRGHRIELAEIEQALLQHSSVQEAVMTVQPDQAAAPSLVAYVVAAPNHTIEHHELRRFLQTLLPSYMLPSAFVSLAQLPLTPNGKVNRRALPAPDLSRRSSSDSYVAPRNTTEATLATLWAELLALETVGIHDNFFELGGHSILATQLIFRLRDSFQVELTLKNLFETPTIAGLAQLLEQATTHTTHSSLPTIVPQPTQWYKPFPMTEVQQAYWIGRNADLELGNVSTHSYTELEAIGLDLERFTHALNQLIERHHMLRAIILPEGLQQVNPSTPPYQVTRLDLRGRPAEEVAAQIDAVRQEMSHQVLPADRWPLFDIRVSQQDDQRFRIHISMDALITDIWSYQILMWELAQLYRNPDTVLEPLELSFRDYIMTEAEIQTTEYYQRALNYWMQRLPSLPPGPELALARSPASLEKPHFKRWRTTLDQPTWERLKNQAVQAGLTPAGLLLAAFADVLTTWNKNAHYSITLTLFNRLPLHPQVQQLVGDFTSLILLEIDHRQPASFATRAKRVQEQLWSDLDHRYVSGVRILREWARIHSQTPSATMPIVFTSNLDLDLLAKQSPELREELALGELVYSITQTPQVLIDHQVSEVHGTLVFNWDVVEELFPAGMIDDMFAAYCQLLQRLAHEPVVWQASSQTLIPVAQLAQRTGINATAVPRNNEEWLHSLFATQVVQRPHQLAVLAPNHSLTYQELYQYANRVGHRLRALGVRPNTLVAVSMSKGWEQVVAVLGILHAGAAYLPLDPELPQERLWYLLEHSDVTIVLTQTWHDQQLNWPETVQRLAIDRAEEWVDMPDTPLETVQSPSDLAYVIFTSGSTGRPKGVMIDHRGAVNTIHDINRRFNVGPTDRVLALSSLSFDLSVYDIFGPLAVGGTIVIPEATGIRDPQHWLTLVREAGVTIWNSVPALMKLLVDVAARRADQALQSLRLVMMSGDWIPVDLPGKISTLVNDIQIFSLGGATEASIWSIFYPITHVDPSWRSIPYGQPMENQEFHVLNDLLEPCPVWVVGHLYIGGIGLAQGYWRDAEKTQASFITNPHTGARLYRTGDLGRYLPDGNIEFLGREDFQVKVSGYRIELGEIESTLIQMPGIRAVAVTAHGDARGEKRLAAYYVPEAGTTLNSDELRQFLKTRLPAYMVPSFFTPLEALPLTANGKIDRKALPAPGSSEQRNAPPDPGALTALETALAQLWAPMLGIEQVGIHSSFFELGGNSLVAIRLLDKIRETFQVKISLGDLFNHPSIAGLATVIIQAQRKASNRLTPATALPTIGFEQEQHHEPFPLTDIQYAYWIGRSRALELGSVATHSYVELDVADLEVERLNIALQKLIARHPMLRAIVRRDGRQQILAEVPPYAVAYTDLRSYTEAAAADLLDTVRQRMSHQVFTTDVWPLFEFRAHRLSATHTRLHISVDLLLADVRSFQILQAELLQLYADPDSVLPALGCSFRDYVFGEIALRETDLYQRAEAYWLDRLAHMPPAPELPLAKPLSSIDQPRFSREEATLDADTWARLKARAGAAGLTASGLLCAAFAEILGLWSQRPQFTINLTTFNRFLLHPDVDALVGDFTSTTLLAVDTTDATFEARARRLQEQIWNDLEHRMFSGIRVLRQLRQLHHASGLSSSMPVVFTSTLIQDLQANSFLPQPPGWDSQIVYSISQTPQVLLDHQIFEHNGVLFFNWDYVDAAFPQGMIQTMFTTYCRLLYVLAEGDTAWKDTTLWEA